MEEVVVVVGVLKEVVGVVEGVVVGKDCSHLSREKASIPVSIASKLGLEFCEEISKVLKSSLSSAEEERVVGVGEVVVVVLGVEVVVVIVVGACLESLEGRGMESGP